MQAHAEEQNCDVFQRGVIVLAKNCNNIYDEVFED